MTILEWFQTVSPNVAIFFGAVTGSFVGLFALLLGALYNARLNRARDARLHNEERRSLAAALSAELRSVVETLERNKTDAGGLRNRIDKDFVVPDLSRSIRIFPSVIDKIGLLDAETIRKVIEAQVAIDQHCDMLIIHGATLYQQTPDRRMIRMPATEIDNPMLIALNADTLKLINTAIESLDPYLRPPPAARTPMGGAA